MKRRKGIRWDYNGDGRYSREQIKGWAKRYWRRWARRGGRRTTDSAAGSVVLAVDPSWSTPEQAEP